VFELRTLRRDLGAFCEAVGHPLTAWQLAALALEPFITVIVAPRQSGKSRALVLACLWWCFRRPAQSVAIVGASEESAKRDLRLAAEIVASFPPLAASTVDAQSRVIEFTNGSRLQAYALSEPSLRGPTHDFLAADEMALHPESAVAAYMPTVAARAERAPAC
jgi:Terminase large subunit, T4likevirus-type, N-terminal